MSGFSDQEVFLLFVVLFGFWIWLAYREARVWWAP